MREKEGEREGSEGEGDRGRDFFFVSNDRPHQSIVIITYYCSQAS